VAVAGPFQQVQPALLEAAAAVWLCCCCHVTHASDA
jgi:hypothetical protein